MQYLFVRGIGYAVGWEMRKDVERYSVAFEAPGVEVHCLHGYGIDTVNR
jgi:lysophospholipase-3